jgi:hypothetical protein
MWTKHIDKKLIILHVLLEEYQKTGITEIRRSMLKSSCIDKLINESGGSQEIYGGSFERYLKQLEELRAINIKRVTKTTKVTITTIISDIPRIESLLLNKRMYDTIDMNMKIARRQIEYSLWEEIIVEEVGSILDKKRRELVQNANPELPLMDDSLFHPVMKETVTKIASNLASRIYEFHIAHNDDRFQWDRDLMIDFGMLARKISSRNPRAPFSIFIEYKGKSDGEEKLGLVFGHAVFKIIAESFLKWTKLFNYDVSQEDIEKISSGHVYLLSGDTKKYYDIFYSVLLKKYMTAWGESLKDLAV